MDTDLTAPLNLNSSVEVNKDTGSKEIVKPSDNMKGGVGSDKGRAAEEANEEREEDGEKEKDSIPCVTCGVGAVPSSLKTSMSEMLLGNLISRVVPWFCDKCRTCTKCGDGNSNVSHDSRYLHYLLHSLFCVN